MLKMDRKNCVQVGKNPATNFQIFGGNPGFMATKKTSCIQMNQGEYFQYTVCFTTKKVFV